MVSDMKQNIAVLLCMIVAILLVTPVATADESAAQQTLSAERMWELARLGEADISPDGKLAVTTVTRFDIEENRGTTHLWLFTLADGSSRPLTGGKSSASSPRFSPDGKYVAFVSKRDDDKAAQIYLIPIDGGEARRLTNVPTGADAPKWFPDSRRIAFVTPIWIDLVTWDDQRKRLEEREEGKMTAQVWDRAPIAYWDHYLDDREPHLFSIGLDGAEPQAITRLSSFHLSKADYSSSSFDISPDGTEVAFETDTDRSGVAPNMDVILLATCGCKPARNLTLDNPADDGAPSFSPDGKWLAYGSQSIPGFYADRRKLKLLERSSGKLVDLSGDWDRSVSQVVWRGDAKSVYAAVDDAAISRIYRIDIAAPGKPRAITGQASFSLPAIARASGAKPIAVALRQSFSEPPTLVKLDLANGSATALSRFNAKALAAVHLGKVESVTYAGSEDAAIQMWVVYPPDFDPRKKYPVFMLLHGGPHNAIQDAVQWRWNAHVFASWGYIVTWHNFHGSSGFGQAFTDSINPDRISKPYVDTIRAAEWLAAKPYVDAERMVSGGGSYGGFLASTLLGRAHPFKALIAHAAVYNNFTQIAADYGAERDRFFEFWERPEEFARYSPHTSAGNFVTPTLVIHGQFDLRVPVNHGVELFNTLQKRGVASKFVYYPDENHWILKPQNSLFWYRTVKEWVEEYAPPGGR
jgi:dipeptidyl aminopeptidase/acylaminoacyl peptidase